MMDGWVDRWMMDGWMDGWMDDGWLDACMVDGWMIDGWMEDGWMLGREREGNTTEFNILITVHDFSRSKPSFKKIIFLSCLLDRELNIHS